MIRLSLLEMEEHDPILLSGKKVLNQRILELLRRISDGLIPTYWNIIRASNSPLHTRHGRVFYTPGEMMRASRHGDDCLIESILDLGDDTLHSFGFSYCLV